jgi:SH3 domain-containing YSC84-like protein 1
MTRMKRGIALLALMCIAYFAWADQTKDDVEDRMDEAASALKEIESTPDKGIPPEVLKEAKCVAIVPSMVKAGFIIGAKHGRGVSTCKLPNGSWSAPAFFEITGGSLGAQAGGANVQLVMMIMNDEGKRHLYRNKFKFGAGATAAAGPVGSDVSTDQAWKMNSEMLTYSRAKGAFAGVDLGGSNFSSDDDATVALYGKDINSRDLLTGQVPAPASAHNFLAAVQQSQAAAMAQAPAKPENNKPEANNQ